MGIILLLVVFVAGAAAIFIEKYIEKQISIVYGVLNFCREKQEWPANGTHVAYQK